MSTTENNSSNESKDALTKQIKFAVVMYGGGSLAIYINGVAQELLKMAQATDPRRNDFSGTSLVYRKIALLLSDKIDSSEEFQALRAELARIFREFNDAAGSDKVQIQKQLDEKKNEINKLLNLEQPTVRFVIDVLTGSSAGGINAVYLAKALVNNLSLEDLKKLWLTQGDFAVLLNDRKSVADNSLAAPREPASLLNSQRMYLELLKALDGMDDQPGDRISVVDELDLYVTFTDFAGVPLPIQLSDKTVLERKHRQVFNFRYNREGTNDFKREINPFLAFAARSTSAFPVAFEPMKLTDIDEIIDNCLPAYRAGKSCSPDWKKYFREVRTERGEIIEWKNRSLVDGGCLDNKPFGFAIDKITERQAAGIIERKLVYIDPSAEEIKLENPEKDKPNAIQNVLAQASLLPRYEPIREDLQRVLDRNRLINRVNRLTAEAARDFANVFSKLPLAKNPTGKWDDKCIDELIMLKGEGSILYYRLRVSALTDNIARLVTRYLKIEPDSDYFNALRALVRAWREEGYCDYSHNKGVGERKPIANFLAKFDVEYRLRRLSFVTQKAEYLLRNVERALATLSSARIPEKAPRGTIFIDPAAPASAAQTYKRGIVSEMSVLANSIDQIDGFALLKIDKKEFESVVRAFQTQLNKLYQRLLDEWQLLQAVLSGEETKYSPEETAKSQSFRAALDAVVKQIAAQKNPDANNTAEITKFAFDALKEILKTKEESPEAVHQAAEKLYQSPLAGASVAEKLRPAAAELETYLGRYLIEPARSGVQALLGLSKIQAAKLGINPVVETIMRNYLKQFYEIFDSYDQISFPVLFETPVGEAVPVDLVRISSRDAQSLINEEQEEEKRRKLTGDFLFSFGAFLEPRWRQNDIMWGRLDGAERLIATLLPGEENAALREIFYTEAHDEILKDELLTPGKVTLKDAFVDALCRAKIEAAESEAIDQVIAALEETVLKGGLNTVLTGCLGEAEVRQVFAQSYEVSRRLEPKPTLDMISRATQVSGRILEKISEKEAQNAGRLTWIAKLGQIFWGLVTVAAPNTLSNLIFNYWLQLFYLFEVFVIIGSTLLANSTVQQFGIIAFLVTVSVHLAVLALHDQMRGESFLKLLKTFSALLILVFAATGFFFFYVLAFGSADLWRDLNYFRESLSGYETLFRLFPLAMLSILLLGLFGWREARYRNPKQLGLAILCFALVLGVAGGAIQFAVKDLPPQAILNLEFASTVTELAAIVSSGGKTDANRVAVMKTALAIDSFIFIPLYVLAFLLLTQLLAFRRAGWFGQKTFLFFLKRETWIEFVKRYEAPGTRYKIPAFAKNPRRFLRNSVWLAALAAVITIAAGAADGAENYYSYRALQLLEQTPDRFLYCKTVAAITKFFLIFAGVMFLALNFYRPPKRRGLLILFIGLILISAAGLAFTLIPSLRDWIEGILLLQILSLVIIAFVLIRFGRDFLNDF